MRRQQLRPRAPPRLFRVATTTTAQPRTHPRPVSFVQQRRRQLSRAPCLAPAPSCGDDDDSSAACPAPPRLLRAAAATTAQPCALPCPISFVQRRRRQLSRAPRPAPSPSWGEDDDSSAVRPAPSPSCGEDDDSSATRPAPPHLLRAVATTTTQPRALPRPVSFVWRRRRQLSRAPCLHAPTATTAQPRTLPSCSGSDDSSGRAPPPVSFVQRRRRQLRQCAPPRLLRAAAAATAQP